MFRSRRICVRPTSLRVLHAVGLNSVLLFLLAACSSSSDQDATLAVDGTAQKGLFEILEVEAFPVDGSNGELGAPEDVTVTDQNFSVAIAHQQLTLFEAGGTFTSEITGESIIADEPLKLILSPDTVDVNANINIATTLVAELVLRDLRIGGVTDIDALIEQHTEFVNQVFGFPPGTDPSQLDFNLITDGSDMTDPNLQLLIISGGIVELLTGDQLYAGGFQAILDGILAAQSVDEAVAVLDVLGGLSANAIFRLAQEYSGFDLPMVVLSNDFYVYNCGDSGSCNWQEVTDPLVSVSGTTAWEAGGKARLYVRLNEMSTEDVVVLLETTSDTATQGEDFIGIVRQVRVPAGQMTVAVDVDLIIDGIVETTEELAVAITSQTDAYSVFQGNSTARIRDGASSSFDLQDATGMQIVSLDLKALCNPVVNMGEANCTSLTGQESMLGIVDGRVNLADVEIDLAADCTDPTNCPQRGRNWLVNFYLVAKDNGSMVGEVPLGPYVYTFNSVQLASDPPLPRMPLIRLTDDASLVLAGDAELNSWSLELEARLGAVNTIAAAETVPALMEVPGSVLVGDTLLDIGVVYDVMPGVDHGCTQAQYAIDAQYLQPGSPYVLGTGTMCVDFDPADTTSPAVMAESRLDLFGGTAPADARVNLVLPSGLVTHVEIDVGFARLETSGESLSLFPTNPAATVVTELHAHGWPFVIIPNAVALTTDGIEISYSDMRYVMDVGYSSQDPRSTGILYSNDIFYRGVSGQGGTLLLGANGVTGDITVVGGPFQADSTAFPRARVEWLDFSQSIIDNKLQATSVDIDEYRMGQSTSCSGPDCVGGRKDYYFVAGTDVMLDGKGYVVGDVNNTGANQTPRWGARPNGGYAWSRPDDLVVQSTLKLAIPGYIIPGDQEVSDVILGHLDDPAVPGDIAIHPLGSDAATDGNYYPTGLSIGPEIYRNGSGTPESGEGVAIGDLGTSLQVANGVDPVFDLDSSAGVKYVMRNAGITGVFNVASGTLGTSAPQFYGYPLDLSRFAVRTVDNVLDTYTWIDGRLDLNGDAGGTKGLDIFFTNLEIDCSARLGNVDLVAEACDANDNNGNGFTDENCNPELDAWKTRTDIFAAGFTGNARGQVCRSDRQAFGLKHQMYFAALDKPVAFETAWSPAGNLVDQQSGELSTYRLDRSDEGAGFPIKTDGAELGVADVDGDRYGWLELEGTRVGVPFWNALDSDTRVANERRFNEITAEPTVILKKGELGRQVAAQRNKDLLSDGNSASANDNNLGIKAEYEWGRTGFGFRLPVYYQPWQLDRGQSDADAAGRQSRFLGRQLTKDLFVLDANAGINFIEPDRTKLSFGASADFTRLEGIEFQIDIADPKSAAAVDAMLQDLRITNGPLFEPALTELLDTVDVVNRIANRGLDELMQQALETAVEEVGKATAPLTPNGQDPFVTASETLSQFRSMPQQMIALINGELRAPLNNGLFTMERELRDRLIAAEQAILALPDNATEQQIDDAFAIIDEILPVLDQVEAEARAVDDKVTGTLEEAQRLILRAAFSVQDIQRAMNDINLVLRQAATFADAACDDGLLLDQEGGGFLNTAAERIGAVRQVTDIIRNTNEWLGAAETIARNEDVKRRLGTARQRVRDATDDLVEFVEVADDAISELVCLPGQADEIVVFAENWTNKINTQLQGAVTPLLAANAALQQMNTIRTVFAERVFTPINYLRESLGNARRSASDFNGAELNEIVSCLLYDATHDDACVNAGNVPDAVGPYGVNALAASAPNERDVADLIFEGIEDQVNDLFRIVEDNLIASTRGLMPGAYMSPEELRRTLVTEIMRSEPVRNLRTKMDEHFAEVAYAMNGIVLQIIDQVNAVVEDALSAVTGPINDALREATAAVRGIPLQSAGMNGFATIAGNELERAHISAGWTMRGADDDDATGFKAALDAESWSARNGDADLNTPTACHVGANESLLDVKISAYGLPINVLAADIDIEKLYLGFTLQNNTGGGPALIPIGIFGGINTIGEIGFSEAIVFDPAFAAALGEKQTYIGASAGAVFSSLTADVAFLVGRVCPGNTVLTDLDPEVEKFLPNLPASGFTGAYLRGGATIPIIPGGCALNVGVVADFGTWLFVGRPTVFGGLVGGGATGQVACIAALKGKVTVAGSASTDGDLKLTGEGWGVAGAGFDCDPGTWTSVSRSRQDDWCGTGDAQFDATFDNGKWKVNPPKPSILH